MKEGIMELERQLKAEFDKTAHRAAQMAQQGKLSWKAVQKMHTLAAVLDYLEDDGHGHRHAHHDIHVHHTHGALNLGMGGHSAGTHLGPRP